MTPRDFICTPSEWITHSVLNGISDDAELLFRRLAQCTDAKWRFPFDYHNVEHSVRTAVFAPQRRFRAWNPDRIRRALGELTAAGMLTRLCQHDRHWFEIADAMRYVKGRDPLGIESPPVQAELPEMGTLFAMPPPDPFGRAQAPPPRAVPSAHSAQNGSGFPRGSPENGVREEPESKKENDPESARATRDAKPPPARDSGFRSDAAGKDSGRFARDANAVPHDPLWESLCRTLGLIEMKQNGALWITRYKLCRDALAVALSDFQGMKPENRAKYNAAAYVTTAFESEKRRCG